MESNVEGNFVVAVIRDRQIERVLTSDVEGKPEY